MYVHIHICVYIYIYIYVCVCTYRQRVQAPVALAGSQPTVKLVGSCFSKIPLICCCQYEQFVAGAVAWTCVLRGFVNTFNRHEQAD